MNATGATLIAHSPKFKCTVYNNMAPLAQYTPPPGTDTWRPVAHHTLVGTLLNRLSFEGLAVMREQYAVSANGMALFGTLDLDDQRANGRAMALGFRHSNDRRMAVSLVGGTRVFVCDNLALGGSKVAVAPHTKRLNLGELLKAGVRRLLEMYVRFEAGVRLAEETALSLDEAKVRLFDLRYLGVLPVGIADQAAENYLAAEKLGYEDSAPRTAWGLHNACTRAAKALAPASQYRTLRALGQHFGLGEGTEVVGAAAVGGAR